MLDTFRFPCLNSLQLLSGVASRRISLSLRPMCYMPFIRAVLRAKFPPHLRFNAQIFVQ